MNPTPVKIAWFRLAQHSAEEPLTALLSAAELEACRARAQAAPHPCFKLDVVAPEPALSCRVLDTGELGQALRTGQVSVSNAALALEHAQRLLDEIHQERFPPPEVRAAERFSEAWRAP